MKSINFLNVTMHCETMINTLQFIEERLDASIFTQHAVVNVAKVVHMQTDEQLADSVSSCDIINIDGMGVVWGARFLGFDVPERVTGVDLFYKLLELSARRGFPVFLLGATDEVVHETALRVKLLYPDLDIAGYHNGYFWDNEKDVVEKIKASGARLLFVAVTSPKKENFINKWKMQLGVDFVMGVGGTFDVVAGKVNRAPRWMQNAGLEWLYRVYQEPKRMWRRYFFTNTMFVRMLLKAKFSIK